MNGPFAPVARAYWISRSVSRTHRRWQNKRRKRHAATWPGGGEYCQFCANRRLRSLRRMSHPGLAAAAEDDGDGMSIDWRCHDLLDHRFRRPRLMLEQFLTGYWSARTRANYAFILDGWFNWCTGQRQDPLRDGDPRVVECWITAMQARPYAANTIAARVSAVSAFYRWCVREQLLNRNPVEAIRRPARPSESSTASLTRHQLTDWLQPLLASHAGLAHHQGRQADRHRARAPDDAGDRGGDRRSQRRAIAAKRRRSAHDCLQRPVPRRRPGSSTLASSRT